MNKIIFDLIKFIVWRATEVSGGLSTLSLVKFLYLADLYYAEETEGKTLTDLPWIFYHYGPYCADSYRAIDDAVKLGFINQKNYESKYEDGKEYHWYSLSEEKEPKLDIPSHVWWSLFNAIGKYPDTRDLMNYVYFETLPMQTAKEKAPLDFSGVRKIKPEQPISMNKLSAKKIKKAHEIINKIRQIRTKSSSTPYAGLKPVYDESYRIFDKTLDQDFEVPKLSGKLCFFD